MEQNPEIPDFGRRHIERQKIYDQFRQESLKKIEELAQQFRDTLRNLSLACGAIAAAGISSINLASTKLPILILGGSLLLLILSAIAFCYLLFTHWGESKSVMKFRHGKLKSMEELLNDFDLVLAKRLPLNDYLDKEKTFEQKTLEDYQTRNLDADTKEDNLEICVSIALVIGIILIVCGFLIPFIWPNSVSFF